MSTTHWDLITVQEEINGDIKHCLDVTHPLIPRQDLLLWATLQVHRDYVPVPRASGRVSSRPVQTGTPSTSPSTSPSLSPTSSPSSTHTYPCGLMLPHINASPVLSRQNLWVIGGATEHDWVQPNMTDRNWVQLSVIQLRSEAGWW